MWPPLPAGWNLAKLGSCVSVPHTQSPKVEPRRQMPVRPLRLSVRRILRNLFLCFSMMLACCCLNAQVTFSASQLVFPDTVQGATSPPQSIVVTNNSASPVLLFSPSFNAGGFGMTQWDCPFQAPIGTGGALAAGAGCTIQIKFTPYGIGLENATLSIYVTDQASNFVNQPSVMLSGTGLQPPASADLRTELDGAFPNPVQEGSTVTLQVGTVNL